MNREQRQELARLTLAALETGCHHTRSGSEVSIGAWQHAAVQGSLLYRPADAEALGQEPGHSGDKPAEIQVYQATTLEAAAVLSQEEAFEAELASLALSTVALS